MSGSVFVCFCIFAIIVSRMRELAVLLIVDLYLMDNSIQNFCLGRCIVGYTVGNLVLRRRTSGAV